MVAPNPGEFRQKLAFARTDVLGDRYSNARIEIPRLTSRVGQTLTAYAYPLPALYTRRNGNRSRAQRRLDLNLAAESGDGVGYLDIRMEVAVLQLEAVLGPNSYDKIQIPSSAICSRRTFTSQA